MTLALPSGYQLRATTLGNIRAIYTLLAACDIAIFWRERQHRDRATR